MRVLRPSARKSQIYFILMLSISSLLTCHFHPFVGCIYYTDNSNHLIVYVRSDSPFILGYICAERGASITGCVGSYMWMYINSDKALPFSSAVAVTHKFVAHVFFLTFKPDNMGIPGLDYQVASASTRHGPNYW